MSNERNKPLFGHRLQRLRKKLRVTQQEMASMLCCSLHAFQDWEKKKYEPTRSHSAVMLELLFKLVENYRHLEITERLQATAHEPTVRLRVLFQMEHEVKVKRQRRAFKRAFDDKLSYMTAHDLGRPEDRKRVVTIVMQQLEHYSPADSRNCPEK